MNSNKQALKNKIANIIEASEADMRIKFFKKQIEAYEKGLITADEFLDITTVERVTA